MEHDLTSLAKIFERLGADDPEGWARSQIEEGLPQLHRYLFLAQAWTLVAGEDDDSWIDAAVARYRQKPDAPYAGAGRALERMLALGVATSDIVDLVRAMQAELLFGICDLLDDPDLDGPEHERLDDLGWPLVTTGPDFEPTSERIAGLHESVLETDPTGREMRPR